MKKFEVSANMRKEMLADFKASTIQFFEKEKIEFNPEYKREKNDLSEIIIKAKTIEDGVGIELKVRKEWLQKIDGEDNPEKALEKFKSFTRKWFDENSEKWNDYYYMQEEEEEEEEEDNDDSDDDADDDDDKKEESLKEMLKKASVNVIDLTEMPKEKRKEILKEIIKKIKNK